DTTTDNGAYVKLMVNLNDGLSAFYNDLKNSGLLTNTLLLSFSEFGRRITENGSKGTDHGAASVMLAMGGQVRGGLYRAAASLNPDPANPTLENSGADVHYETDFRSVYAKVIDNWLGGNSVSVLAGNYKASGIDFIYRSSCYHPADGPATPARACARRWACVSPFRPRLWPRASTVASYRSGILAPLIRIV